MAISPIPTHQELRLAVAQEIKAQAKNKRTQWLLVDERELLEERPGEFIYRLILAEPTKLPVDAVIRLKLPGVPEPAEVQVLSCQEKILVIRAALPLQLEAAMLKVEFDATFILRKLDEHLDQVLRLPPPPLKSLMAASLAVSEDDGPALSPRLEQVRLNESQRMALRRMLHQQVHVLWGPPGTGKTHTIGFTIAEHLRAGRSCLLLSTSNVAVDEMIKAADRELSRAEAQGFLFRAGTALASEVVPYTSLGHFKRQDPRGHARWLEAQQELRAITTGKRQVEGSFVEAIRERQAVINNFVDSARHLEEHLTGEARCVAATLATLVLREDLATREFDVVIIDEASMVSLCFTFAGAAQATQHVILAGDPMQLPPICVSQEPAARKWFGRNAFAHLGISSGSLIGDLPTFVSLLQQQHRMTSQIASIVSELSYGGQLLTADSKGLGVRPLFIDVQGLWPTSWYSVQFKTYYHPFSALLLSTLRDSYREWLGPRNLLLSPYRGQSTLFTAMGQDLGSPELRFEGSTIHKSQGAQQHTVIVDLTFHNATKLSKFFEGESAENLLNVAMSRAQEHLIVIGNLNLVAQLARSVGYWRRFNSMLEERFDVIPVRDILREAGMGHKSLTEALSSMPAAQDEIHLPVVYVEQEDLPFTDELAQFFGELRASSKLLITPNGEPSQFKGGMTYRRDDGRNIQPFAMAKGILALPFRRGGGRVTWAVLHLPRTTKQMMGLACRHFFDDEFQVEQTMRLACSKCERSLFLSRSWGGLRLACDCGYDRRLSYTDARTLIEAYKMLCPECGAKSVPRTSSDGVFVGCSNYVGGCRGRIDLSVYVERRSGMNS